MTLCAYCEALATTIKGVIYVRGKIGTKWTNLPICPSCFDKKEHLK